MLAPVRASTRTATTATAGAARARAPTRTRRPTAAPASGRSPRPRRSHEYSQTHQVTALITLHNVAALVLRPPGLHTNGQAPDETALKELGDRWPTTPATRPSTAGSSTTPRARPRTGTTAPPGTFGYTIEIGPPRTAATSTAYQTGVVDQWTGTPARPGAQGMRGALLRSAEAAANPADHSVIKGRRRRALLRLHKSFQTSTAPVCTVADPAVAVSGCFAEGDPQMSTISSTRRWSCRRAATTPGRRPLDPAVRARTTVPRRGHAAAQ